MTTKFELTTSAGKPYNIELPSPKPDFSSKFVFSFAKSGSTLLNDLLFTYCPQMGVPVVSVFDQAFSQGVDTKDVCDESAQVFNSQGYVFSGFRHFPNFDLDVEKEKCILLVRDPRDMIVSMYYSIAKSHVIPKGNESLQKNREDVLQRAIDDFAVNRINSYLRQCETYLQKLDMKRTKVFRYEDVIYNKREWMSDVLDILDVEKVPTLIKRVVQQFDVIPNSENEAEHIRQVHPGNYKKKLSSETIELVTASASNFLRAFNYD